MVAPLHKNTLDKIHGELSKHNFSYKIQIDHRGEIMASLGGNVRKEKIRTILADVIIGLGFANQFLGCGGNSSNFEDDDQSGHKIVKACSILNKNTREVTKGWYTGDTHYYIITNKPKRKK
jgi:hypothetical protein